MIRRLATAIILSAVLVSSAAFAEDAIAQRGEPNSITDTGSHVRPMDLSVMGFLPFYSYGVGFGVEGRFEIPILPDGFIPAVNDSFAIEPSFGIAYNTSNDFGGYHVTTFSPALYGIWSFWFSSKFRAYGGLGLGYNIATVSGYSGSYSEFYWDPVVGIFYNFASTIAFRAEIGREALKAGVAFTF